MKNKLSLLLLGLLLTALASPAYPAVSTDRTRLVFNADRQTMAMGLSNKDKTKPFLAQVWLEDEEHHKLKDFMPLIAVPPVMRLEPEGKNVVRINKTVQAVSLPTDRETLFYLNVRGIPPKHSENNSLQVAVQTTLKLFYRPESIRLKWGEFTGNKVTLKKTGADNGLLLENPTPYYFTIAGMSPQKDDKKQTNFETFMIPPYSKKEVIINEAAKPKSIWMTFINDFGARNQIEIPVTN